MVASSDTEAILAENGIFPTTNNQLDNTDLTCYICNKDTIVKDFQEHIKKTSHIGTLQRFECMFERRASKVGCKVCNQELTWTMVKVHAFSHTIPPWYEPRDKYQKFFLNQMFAGETLYYCWPCDTIFPEWSTAFVHIIEDSHRASMATDRDETKNTASFNTVETLSELLVSEGFIAGNATEIVCKVCNVCDINLMNIFIHVRGSLHTELKQQFVSTLKSRYLNENGEKPPTERSPVEKSLSKNDMNDTVLVKKYSLASQILAPDDPSCTTDKLLNDTQLRYDKSPCIYIVPQNATDCYCKLCNIKLIGQTTIDHHFKSEWHISSLKEYRCEKISPKENNSYYCECCDCHIPNLENLYCHVTEKQHKQAAWKKRETPTITEVSAETTKVPDNAAHSSRRNLSSNYIEKLNSADFHCRICNVLLSKLSLVEDHIAGTLHAVSVKRYGLDSHITLIGGNKYRCQCCDYMILNVEGIRLHTMDQMHKLNSAVKLVALPSDPVTLKTETTSQPVTPRLTSTSYYVVQISPMHFQCKICNLLMTGEICFANHLAGEQHAKAVNQYGCKEVVHISDNSYYCNACRCSIDPERMLFHVKGDSHAKRLAETKNNESSTRAKPRSHLKTGSEGSSHSLPDLSRNLSTEHSSSEACHPPLSLQTTVENPPIAKPNGAVLNQYGCDRYISAIISDGMKYRCEICKCEIPNPENIYGHITGTRHKSNLKISVNNASDSVGTSSKTSPCCYIVKLNDAYSHCQVCDQTISATAIDDHAAGGQHAAALKRYGCHNILWTEGINYHCKSCRCKIPGLANVFLHIKGSRHRESLSKVTHGPQENNHSQGFHKPSVKLDNKQQLLQNSTQVTNQEIHTGSSVQGHGTSSETQTSVEHHMNADAQETALNTYTGDSNITLTASNKFYCKCCSCIIPSVDNIYVHTSGYKHRSFIKDSIGQSTLISHSPHCLYIAVLSDTQFHCSVCELTLFDQATVIKHVVSEQHTAALSLYRCNKISPTLGRTYYCAHCRCKIPNLPNVYLHIKGIRHMNGLPNKGCLPTNLKEQRTDANLVKVKAQNNLANGTELAPQTAPLDYVIQSNNTDFSCKICNLAFTSRESVDDHLVERTHANARLQYGCDDISALERGTFYCGLCKCVVPNLENVYRHIKGRRHGENVSCKYKGIFAKGPQIIETVDENTSKRLDVSETAPLSTVSLSTPVRNCDPERMTSGRMVLLDSSAIVHQEATNSTMLVPCAVAGPSAVKLQKQSASDAYGNYDDSNVKKSLIDEMRNCAGNNMVEQNRDTKPESIPMDYSENANKSLYAKESSKNVSVNNISSKCKSTKSRALNPTSECLNSEDCDRVTVASGTTSIFTSKKNPNSERKPRLPKKTNFRKVIEVFDFDNDYIYDMNDKLKEIILGIKLSLVIDAKNVYCLVCRSDVEVSSEDYTEHLNNLEHCENFATMKNEHALFEFNPGQFSDFDLALQYMEEISDDTIQCFVCREEIENIDGALNNHIRDDVHEQKRKEAQSKALEKYGVILPRMQCDWYNIHKYRCEPCSANFQNEFTFVKHLNCMGHKSFMKKSVKEKQLIYDFCSPCSLLWYGYLRTYHIHCDTPNHKWITHDGHCVSPDLPKSARLLLATPRDYIEAMIGYLDEVSAQERRKDEALMEDVAREVKLLFPQAEGYIFGSRASGTSSTDSDIDLFLDDGDMYDGNKSSKEQTMSFITSVHLCLSKDTQSWETVQLSTNMETNVPVIKAQHRATGLFCNMFFDNGLGVETTKLIKLMNDIFPECRKLIIFLKQWLTLCDLSGSEGISSYAICWLVIFALQKHSFLPSIATLIEMEQNSHIIAGWEVGVSDHFTQNPELRPSSIEVLLIWFFAFYAKFDYRSDVVCPHVGDAVKKRAFVDLQTLPQEMEAYVTYMKNSNDPEPFRIDSSMCIQDPYDLHRNITKDVSKVCLNRFRVYCAKTRDLLCKS